MIRKVEGKYLAIVVNNPVENPVNNPIEIAVTCADGKTDTIILYTEYIGKNHYRNVMLPNSAQSVRITTTAQIIDLDFSNTRNKTKREQQFLTETIDEVPISYLEKPGQKKLIVTFSGFAQSGKLENMFPVTFAKANEDEFYNATILSIIDEYDLKGSYMQYDDNYQRTLPAVIKFINKKMEELDIKPEDVIFFGGSKGASIASLFLEYYPTSRFILIVPQMNLRAYNNSKPNHMMPIINAVDNYNIDFITDIESKIAQAIDNNTQLDLYLSIKDDSNTERTLERLITKNNARVQTYDLPHGHVIRENIASIYEDMNEWYKDE